MKTKITITIAILSAFMLLNCSTNIIDQITFKPLPQLPKIYPDDEMIKLYDENGNITSIISYDEDGNKTETGYDRDGNITSITKYDEENNITNTIEYEYNIQDNVTRMIEYDENGNRTRITEYEYNLDNNIARKVEYDGNENRTSITEYIYDYKPREDDLIRKIEYDRDGTTIILQTEYEYNVHGDAMRAIQYDGEGNIINNRTYEYVYDNNGNMTSVTEYDGDIYSNENGIRDGNIHYYNGTVINRTEHIYDSNNNLTGTTQYDENNNKTTETEYTYEADGDTFITRTEYNYDDNGNLDGTRTTEETIESEEDNNSPCKPGYNLITTAQELQNIELYEKYCLVKDIDLNGISFKPIGYPNTDITDYNFTNESVTPFIGIIDGNNKTIRGLNIDKNNTDLIGLFAYIDTDGKIKNLTIENPIIKGKEYLGTIAGINKGSIINCHIIKNIEASVNGKSNMGGIAGYNDNGRITDSHSEINVIGKENYIGGLTGYNAGIIENSYNTGNVEGKGYVGGLVGSSTSASSIIQSYAEGDVTGENDITGGLVANNNGSIENSYATGNIEGGKYVGGLVGWNKEIGVITNSNTNYLTKVNGESNVGGLVAYNYGEIKYSNSGAFVEFRGNINIIEKNNIGGFVGYNNGSIEESFSSSTTLGGNAENIGGFAGSNAGLIENSYADNPVHGREDKIGGFVGWNKEEGRIINCNYGGPQQRGDVKAEKLNIAVDTPILYVGGLVGYNQGYIENSHSASTLQDKGVVLIRGEYAGGLVGGNNGTIKGSYAAIYTNISTGDDVGGLVGGNNGTIENSYATGNVAQGYGNGDNTGGLVGGNNGTIENSYATGNVESIRFSWGEEGKNIGGLVGGNNGTITQCYFDTDTTGQSKGVGEGAEDGVTGITTKSSIDTNTFPAWSTTIWNITSGIWPIFQWQD